MDDPTRHADIEPRWLKSRQQTHWTFLVISVFAIVMSFLLQVQPAGRVSFRFAPEQLLPETCPSKVVFRRDCAGCGLTRSFVYIAAMRFRDSWSIHRVGWMVALLTIAQIPYRLLRLRQLKQGIIPTARWTGWVSGFVIVAIILNWFLRQFGI